MRLRLILLVLLSFFLLIGAGRRPDPLPALHQAAAEGKLDEVTRILASDPNALLSRDDNGNLAIHHAAWNGWLPVVKALLDAGTPVDITKGHAGDPFDGATALHAAAAMNRAEIIQLLLKAGANVNAQSEDGATPLHHAAWNGWTDCAKILLDAGANPNARRTNRVTPLESAAFFGHADTVRLLLSRGADPNARVYDGYTPLIQAARNGHIETMQALVIAKASLRLPRDDGQTALHVAAANGQRMAVQALLAMGADPDEKDFQGNTALGVAQGSAADYLRGYLDQRNETESQIAARNALNKGLPKGPLTLTPVYRNEFTTDAVGKEWSTTPTGAHFADLRVTTPIQGKRFLGNFGEQNVRLALPQLPPHRQVTVTLDLLILNTWDGSGTFPGDIAPDIWEAYATSGPLLLRTTFANTDPGLAVDNQAFPGEWPRPQSHHPGRTGAVANNVLRLNANDPPHDAEYHLTFTFAHTDPYVVLNFQGKHLEEISNESWGIARIAVSVGQPKASGKK